MPPQARPAISHQGPTANCPATAKRPATAAFLALGYALISACAQPEDAFTPAVEATQEIRVKSVRVERWPEWSMPEPGPFDESLPKEEMFRPCRDIPDEVAEDLGIRIKRDSEDEFLSFLCEAEFLDPALKNTPVSFTSESVAVSGWFERGNRGFEHFVPGFPEALAARGTILRNASSVSCESMVETSRGVISVSFFDASHEHLPEYLCVQPDRIIRELFERQQASA